MARFGIVLRLGVPDSAAKKSVIIKNADSFVVTKIICLCTPGGIYCLQGERQGRLQTVFCAISARRRISRGPEAGVHPRLHLNLACVTRAGSEAGRELHQPDNLRYAHLHNSLQDFAVSPGRYLHRCRRAP